MYAPRRWLKGWRRGVLLGTLVLDIGGPTLVISLALFASLSQYQPDGLGGRHARDIEIVDTATVADVIELLGLPDEPRVVFVNGTHATEDRLLARGDRLAIFPPVAGG